ncbi:LOW QUALITY PROTEIN: ensconsin-like [Haliotis rubra]|uniref:LOW QUALITY PROTEIN: ensconsin-like n=1 Tax=Haliotis rubra TaxID=36100 RepID=UPI001EE62F62|nr:LOW QUALITY PROTEIN: ensconsin-like [Haliotis rubra]
METEQIVDPDKSWRRSTKSLFKSIKHAFGVSSKKKQLLNAALDSSSTSDDLSQEQKENVSAVDDGSFLSYEPDPTQISTDMVTRKQQAHLPVKHKAWGPLETSKVVPGRGRTHSQWTHAFLGCRGVASTDSNNSSRPTSAASSRSPLHKEKDAAKRYKEKDREERVRQARERMAEERRKKFEELKEQQRLAQENRERQLEMRRRKIAELLRQREEERRAGVEERRKRKEATERQRREEIIYRAQERVARYEQWKLGGRKGGSGHVFGFGSRTPREICQPSERPKRSSSHSALIRRSPNGSDSDYARPQRRALSACSTVRRHCCIDINHITALYKKRSRKGPCPGENPPSKHLSVSMSVLYHKRNPDFASSGMLNNRPDSLLALNAIPEGRRSILASSNPPPQRPKSTVGLNSVRLREQKPRKPRPASIASSMPSFMRVEIPNQASPRSKSTDRLSRDKPNRTPRKSLGSQIMERKKEEEKKENGTDAEKKQALKMNRRSIDRLSQPKQIREKPEAEAKAEGTPAPKKSPRTRLSPRKSLSTTNLATGARKLPSKPILKDKSKEAPVGAPQVVIEDDKAAMSRSAHEAMSRSVMDISSKPTPDIMSKSVDMSSMSKSTQDISVEEYKAKLAEKRRQAREKAEKEAEIERQRLEEERLAEEARMKAEEEEQCRQEEESLSLAEDARRAEEERLRKAIEAEESRKKEEAERLEQERIAKEEAEQRAKEESERQEKERQERMKKEEEERQERKKRLEMIMKRVKTDGSESPKTQSPAKSATSSPSKSGESSTESSAEDGTEETMTTTVTTTGSVTNIVTTISSEDSRPDSGPSSPRGSSPLPSTPSEKAERQDGGDTPKFRSPLLQQLVENKSSSSSSDRPKFKSPLLQNLLGKNKLGARSNEEKVEEKKTDSSLVVNGKQGSDTVINSKCDTDTSSVKEQLRYDDASDEDKDVDTSEKSDGRKGSVEHIEDFPLDVAVKDSTESASVSDLQENKAGIPSATDSGILMDLGTSSSSLAPGPVNGLSHNGDTKDLVDSSISMKSVESVTAPMNDGMTESGLVTSQNDFEEIIDLSVTNKNIQLNCGQESRGDNSEDLLNFNNLDGASEDNTNRTPLIAFEENSAARQDVTDLLS